jgi:phosphoserine phosphatase RsbU/P
MSTPTASVLIVDDDPVFALFVQQLILSRNRDFPCTPQWADTAEKALLELARNRHELMVLDYHLPGADGLQMLARLDELPPDHRPAVIMLTGTGSEAVAVEAMKRGARDYLPKAGLDAEPLMRALRGAAVQKQLADELDQFNAQRQADLEMARQLQQSLLPERYPSFPGTAAVAESALRFCHRFIPAAELAGDFFSVHALSDSCAGIFICDVMGHGVRSALVAAMLRALVDGEAPAAEDPGEFLAHLNLRLGELIKSTDGPMYATAFYLIADAARGRMRFATAGHPRPLLLRRSAGGVEPLTVARPAGAALGLLPEAGYATAECPFTPGDVVLLFTDGLFEVVGADESEFGRDRLQALVQEHLNLPLRELCDRLVAEVREFAGGAGFADDVCLLAVEVGVWRGPA